MKILFIGDTHFGIRSNNQEVANYQAEFFNNQLFDYIRNNKKDIDLIIHLGDMFDQRKFLNYTNLKFWIENFIEPIDSFNIPIHLIIGNHDAYYKTTNSVNSPTLLLKDYKNFKVFQDAYENVEGNILYVPWVNPENVENTQAIIASTKLKYCAGHLELAGYQLMPGVNCNHSLITAKSFVKFRKTFSGHFHHRHQLNNIYYLGCPFELTWSDSGNSKGFHIFDTEKNELQFIENKRTQYLKIEYNDKNIEDDYIANIDFSEYSNKFIRLLVKHKENPYLYTQFLSKLYEANIIQLQITEAETKLTATEEIIDVKDISTIIKNNINGREFPEEIKPQLIDYMNSVYNKTLV